MADVTATADWQAVASGEGPASFEAIEQHLRWFVSSSTPSDTLGFTAPPSTTVSLHLEAGEQLYIKGRGTVVVLAANGPTA